jgi:hypothetical protein
MLRGIKDNCMDLLNLMGEGDISQVGYDDIYDLCRRYSRGISKHGKGLRDISTRITKSSIAGVSCAKLANLSEDFKTDILSSLASQSDSLQVKQKQAEVEKALSIFCPWCRKKHPLRECPLDNIEICSICEIEPPYQQLSFPSRIKSSIPGYQ